MPQIKLQSSDGDIFEVDDQIARCSTTIMTLLENLGMGEGEEEVIPLLNVNSAILEKVITWATHHKDDLSPVEDDDNQKKKREGISSWDTEFLKVDQETLFEIMKVANYLDMKELLDMTCISAGNMIKGKTPDEIRKICNIENDLTAADEEQIRKENEWCFEEED